MRALARKLATGLAGAALAFGITAGTASAVIIDFGGLPGANEDPFASVQEDGFQVTAQLGKWFEAHIFGNPQPSIFAGPIGSPSLSSVSVTRIGGGDFTFTSVDLSSNNGRSDYEISGFLNGAPVFSKTGNFQGFPGPWETVGDGSISNQVIDELLIALNPTGQPSSMNLDNINVIAGAVVPEPGSIAMLGLGLGVLGLARRRRA